MSDEIPVLDAASPAQMRGELQAAVLRELHGPAGGPDEEIREPSVRDRYLVGMLAPRRQRVEPEEQDGLAVAGTDSAEEGTAEPDAPSIRTMFPSSFGFTFTVAADPGALRITARYGRYERVHSETLTKDDGSPELVWNRVPVERRIEDVRLAEGRLGPWSVEEERPEVLVHGSVRRRDGEWIVSLFLVNTQTEPDKRKDAAWVFQPELSVEAMDGAAVFVRRWLGRGTNRVDPVSATEDAAMAMLYRRHVEFAVGHGVAVHAEPSPDDPSRALRVSTRVVPRYEVPAVNAPRREEVPGLAGLVLDMKKLDESAREELAPRLRALPEAYRRWIEDRRGEIGDPASGLAGHEESARAALDACARACLRIEEGIALLGRDAVAADAFRFMNRAMALQRVHTLLSERARRGEEADLAALDTSENHSWYPFQLAFILLSLPGVTDLHHKDRSPGADAVADLLWFPTGGGKTEAYLGLSAYTLALRRLQGEVAGRSGEAGVAVLMRYTLRLLTLQQFQRAVALVCACEKLRRNAVETGDARFGVTPFRIGLWVGQRTTPNRTEESIEAIKRDHGRYARASIVGGRGSPAQLTNCPWCGSRIEPGKHIKGEPFSKGRGRTLLYCGDPLGRCLFSEKNAPGEGIPALVVDEEIYRLLPSILIATVDKFAQMPWQGATQTLFGQVNGRCPRHGFRAPELSDSDSHTRAGDLPAVRTEPCGPLRPPDLVIQDELHLISGPLGTLVGLYETSIDRLMTWEVDGKPVRPKVIASTATIRRAREQVHGLFLRKVEVFPPHGTDVADNFFSRQRKPEEKPGRVYLGICAHGKRLKGALIRVYVAFLAAAQQLYERHGAAADPWMTLVGYFNSIRELGGMRRGVDDDVRTRLRRMEQRGLARRDLNNVEELTSRKGSTDIPRILDWLEERFDPKLDEQRKAKRERRPLDVILATNMISVGVDVRRLGLMVVAGQPKTTAEYIQATSRVGRQMPGIVCTVFNWARPRDVSHYERFEHYHATFYQHVEALSVTPFAARALDRALSAQLVALVRLSGMEFNENLAAARVEGAHERVKAAVEAIAARAEEVVGSREVADEVRTLLRGRLDVWQAQARRPGGGSRLGYKTRKDGQTIGLLKHAGQGSWEDFTCLDSLRDVEPTSALVLDDHGLDDEGARLMSRERVGEVRQSQLLFTFGVGSVVDLPCLSVLVMGTEDWPATELRPVIEERLLLAVRAQLGAQVERLCLPPLSPESAGGLFNPFDDGAKVGVPVAPLPRWMRCPSCNLLAPLSSGLFELKTNAYRPDQSRYVHLNCQKRGKPPTVLPARFLMACERGHLDDFPWVHFVHRGEAGCGGALKLDESGVSGEARDVLVICTGCGKTRRMAEAFGEEGRKQLPSCRARRPHLRDFADDGCPETPHTILLGASNAWFPMMMSALSIPTATGKLGQLVEESWAVLEKATSLDVLKGFRAIGQLQTLAEFPDEELWKAVGRKRAALAGDAPVEALDVKAVEWEAFSRSGTARNARDFRLTEVAAPEEFRELVSRVVLVERLREVRALVGFTRIGSPGDFSDLTELPEDHRGTLSRSPPRWVPASEVRGEGIFLQLAEESLRGWERGELAGERADGLSEAHRRWRIQRRLASPAAGFPGVRYVLLHTLAHVLIRQLAVECGYTAASIRERIYARPPTAEGGPMAGLLLYTAAPDSEGTLGGLVDLGRPENLGRHLAAALEHAGLCSSDPLCAEHHPYRNGVTLHGAACHACLFLPETSCERGNRYLDRTLLVPTFGREEGAYFER